MQHIRRYLPLDKPALPIICTQGPSVFQTERLTQGGLRVTRNRLPELLKAGMRVMRINFSHVSEADYEHIEYFIREVRELERQEKIPIPILMDLKGSELRIRSLRLHNNEDTNEMPLKKGDKVCFVVEQQIADNFSDDLIGGATVQFDGDFYRETKEGHRIVIGDNDLYLRIESTDKEKGVVCVAESKGCLRAGNSINLPDQRKLEVEPLPKEDVDVINHGFDVDLIAQSLIQEVADITWLEATLANSPLKNTPIIAKIETPGAVLNIDGVLQARSVFGIMVARGDLGTLTEYQKIPKVQKELIDKANILGKPVIVATQMLESMIERPRPWRPEVQDIATAIEEGADALMLSGETAKGDFPVESVQVMAKVIDEYSPVNRGNYLSKFDGNYQLRNARRPIDTVGYAICEVAKEAKSPCILSYATTGKSATMISRFRPEVPIVAITVNPKIARLLALLYNVYPVLVEGPELRRQPDEFVEFLKDIVHELGLQSAQESAQRRFFVATQEIAQIVNAARARGIFVFDP